MKKIKKLVGIIMCAALVFSCIACGNEGEGGGDSEGKKKIGVAVGSATDVWATYWMDEVEAYGAQFPEYEFAFEDAGDYDLSRQISQVENFINNGYDFFTTNMISVTSFCCNNDFCPLLVSVFHNRNVIYSNSCFIQFCSPFFFHTF